MKTSLFSSMFRGAALSLLPLSLCAQAELKSPFKVEAAGKPIDVEIGHAAPLVVDFDGDGLNDLLVGQFGSGKLRIYRNQGTKDSPKFEDFALFKAGFSNGTVPTG